MIISELNNCSGFFSSFFFMMNHFLYSKKNNLNFRIDSNNWLFKYNNGWLDYFEDISFYNNENIVLNSNNKIAKFGNILYNYPIIEYKNILWDVYKYNKNTIENINNTKLKLGLENIDYGAIYIRRGDKLLVESKLYSTEKYIKLLLEKYPQCKIIFLQTDDYNSYIDIDNYIKTRNLDIKILTLCEKHERGTLVDNIGPIKTNIVKNSDYVNNIKNELSVTKPVTAMTNIEKYNHTMTMLVAIDIVINSKYCVFDYQSNISRFIKLAHKNPKNVFDIDGFELDLNKEFCPAYPESVYNDIDNWRHT